MGTKPLVLFSVASPVERALLRFYFSSQAAPSTVEETGGGLEDFAGKSPQLLIAQPAEGESPRDASMRLRQRFPHTALVMLIDAAGAGPAHATGAEPHPGLDAVLVRPLTVERIDAVLSPVLRRAALPQRPRVLVVDDDPEVLHFVEQVLGKAGCDVTAVSDPQRYLARTTAPEFDLALLDVVMPEVDGLQICVRLRETGRSDLRICMMSARHDPETERKADLYGADEFIPKPLHVRELHALISRTRLHTVRRVPGRTLRAIESPARGSSDP
jgi:CheY-like chemotaxis protein